MANHIPEETRLTIASRTEIYRSSLPGVHAFVIADQGTYEQAAALCKQVKGEYKHWNDERQQITRPILQAKNAADAFFKPGLDALAEIERVLRAKMADYTVATTRAQAAVMHASAVQAAAGIIPTTPIPEPPAAPGVSSRVRWSFEVFDPDAVPRELCSPDAAKIAQAIAYADTPHTPPREIPGVRFHLEAHMRVGK